MINTLYSGIVIFALFLGGAANAETLYVTDRILLGVHKEANEISPLIKAIPSGTAVTVVQRNEDFTKVKLDDGTEGWVSKNYLSNDKTATAKLDELQAKLDKAQASNQDLQKELANKERELQTHRDQLSNAKSNIKELKTKLNSNDKTETPAPNTEELDQAKQKIQQLEQTVAKLEQAQSEPSEKPAASANAEVEELVNENQNYQARISAALANLKGETVPSASELAAIRPTFPLWYWVLLGALLFLGIAVGVFGMDLLHRRRHGGFRL